MPSDSKMLAKKIEFQQVLVELSQLRPPSLASALRTILTALSRTLHVARASYWSLAPGGDSICCVQLFASSSGMFASGTVLERKSYPTYFDALLTSTAIVANDAVTDPRTREFAVGYFDVHGIRSMLDVPVWNEGALAGVLCCEHVDSPRVWTVDEEDFARSVANIIAVNLAAGARARAEERYRLISRAIGDVVWEWDFTSDELEWAGERLSEVFGHPVTAETSAGAWWSAHIHPADRSRILQSIDEVVASGQSAWDGEYRFMRGDGTYAYVFDRGFVTYDERGTAVRMTGVVRDVTEKKTLEERLMLSDRLASLGTLAAGVAHEINNPLAYVRANVEHVREILRGHAVERDVADALDDALMGADRMRRIVSDLAIFSRTSKDPDAAVDLDRVVESALTIAQSEMRQHARVVRKLGSPPPVRGTEARLGQVVINLLVNAAHAVRGGASPGEIIITTRTNERGAAVLEVSDNGVGIDPRVLPRIFDPFFTTKTVGEGTGLGLSISHSIVTSMGGEIEVDSTPGAGTTFRVTLPVTTTGTESDADSQSHPPPPTGPRPRVLVVDDEPAMRTCTQRLLAREYDVELCDSGRSALTRLAETPFDVVLCDVMMPDGSGLDMHAVLSVKNPELARRLVFMTGGAFSEEARELLERTSLPLIHKPFDGSELRRIVAEVARPRPSA